VIDPGIVWGSFLGGSADDGVRAVATDAAGNAYLAGYSFSADLPGAWTGAGGNADSDVMVAKLSADGKRLLYVTYIGNSGGDAGYGIAVGPDGAAYVVGDTTGNNFPTTTGALDTTGSTASGFALKLTPDGQTVSYATYVTGGTVAIADARGVAVNSSGQAFVVGSTSAALVIGGGTAGAYVLQINAAGSAAVFNTTLTGTGAMGTSAARAVAIDASAVYVTGGTGASDFMGTTGVFGTGGGAFVTKLTMVDPENWTTG